MSCFSIMHCEASPSITVTTNPHHSATDHPTFERVRRYTHKPVTSTVVALTADLIVIALTTALPHNLNSCLALFPPHPPWPSVSLPLSHCVCPCLSLCFNFWSLLSHAHAPNFVFVLAIGLLHSLHVCFALLACGCQ